MTEIYFVRHAMSDKTVHDDRTRPLTAEGTADSEKVTELLLGRNIDVIVSSPYKRCIDTVKGLAQALGKNILTDEDSRKDTLEHGSAIIFLSLSKSSGRTLIITFLTASVSLPFKREIYAR